MTVTEKVAYLKGLSEGLGIDNTTKEGKLLLAIVDVIDEIALTCQDLEDSCDELTEYCESLDEDLGDIEEFLFDDEDDYDDDDAFGFICPSCGEEIELTPEDYAAESIICPVCDQEVELDFGCDCGCEDDCDCDDDCDCGCKG